MLLVGESQFFKEVVDLFFKDGFLLAPPRDVHVVVDGLLLKEVEVLIDDADVIVAIIVEFLFAEGGKVHAVVDHLARGDVVQPTQHIQEGGLAAAALAQHEDESFIGEGQVDMVKSTERVCPFVVLFDQIDDLKHFLPSCAF